VLVCAPEGTVSIRNCGVEGEYKDLWAHKLMRTSTNLQRGLTEPKKRVF
jgi:hypothetical protein